MLQLWDRPSEFSKIEVKGLGLNTPTSLVVGAGLSWAGRAGRVDVPGECGVACTCSGARSAAADPAGPEWTQDTQVLFLPECTAHLGGLVGSPYTTWSPHHLTCFKYQGFRIVGKLHNLANGIQMFM